MPTHRRLLLEVLCLAVLASIGCGPQSSNVASKYVASAAISAAQGGTLTVTASDDPTLAGTSITIPANALSSNTTITIGVGTGAVAPSGTQAAGPVAEFGPDGTTFAVPVTITLPYSLPAGGSTSLLHVAAVESNGTRSSFAPAQLTVNTSASTVSFQATGFTNFGAYLACGSDSDCPAYNYCVNGACASSLTCATGQTACGSSCTDLATDSANCGACGNACPSGASCTNGACPSTAPDAGPCASGETSCGGNCTDTQTDPDNCGGCGSVCPSGESCVGATCVPPSTCMAGETSCPSGCTNTDVDPDNCGSCGNVCASGASCSGGTCSTPSGTDAGPSDGGPGLNDAGCTGVVISCGGVNTNVMSDPQNCGGCGNACPSGVACSCGVCGGSTSVDAGSGLSDGGLSDGGPPAVCQVNSDCASGQSCVNGTCTGGGASDAGSGLSDGGSSGGQQTCQADSDCASGEVCVGGLCQGNGVTDGGSAASDAGSAGACQTNADCASGESCVNGVCTGAACAAAPAVCNGVRTNLENDPDNCGACGSVCPAGDTCNCGICG